ncbi:DUF3987 domain-containing protein [Acinetobacter parvus]|uniref:DUF3987 domain-containing protein n=1 Tax=Acinetobacter parvus NIPH 1103 TaxID=1217671 RepID=N8Q477_9GAMM|nr:DUF3987 domain-containing protein [Acinetobacter parvus]ENU33340.1 hypothetical protein F989_01539 [Acinetobacter parvus NIPH 1103]
MNIKPSWDSPPDMFEGGISNANPQKQQSPLERVGNDASDSIIEALEEYTVPLFNNNPLHIAMLEMMGSCPVEIRRSVIENATQYGQSDDNALYGLAVFDLFDENLQPTGAVFTNPTIVGFKDIVFGHGGLYFNRSKLNELPLLVTDDIHLAFKTTYPVYAPYSDSKIKAYTLKALMKAHPDLYVIAPVHQQDDIQRRYTDLNVKIAFIPEPPSFAMSQDELDCMINAAVEKANGIEWGDIIPLDNSTTSKAMPYPIQALPPLLQGAATAIAEYVQAPIAMTAQCIIGAISHIAQVHVNAPHQFKVHGEPCSLFLLTEGQSGSRKSTSKNLADKAITEYERKAYDQYKDDVQQWKTLQAGLPKADREAFLAENPPPNDPSSLFSDGTLEAVAGLYIDGVLKSASISSDEAAQFFGGHTMKSDTRTQALGSFTKLFDDGSIQRTRSKSNLNGSGRADDVRLTFNLQGQHEVLSDALRDDVLREQGFLPRFILSAPENLAGTRLHDAEFRQKNANLDHRLIAYWERCKTLLDPCPMPLVDGQQQQDRRVIQLSSQADMIDLAFYNECEEQQLKGGKYEHIQPFASRASQLARRLATVFAFFQDEQEITAQTMQGACDIIRHSLGEWLRYAEIESKKESDAQRLLNWLVKKCVEECTNKIQYSTMQTSCPRPMSKNKQMLEMTAQQLEDTNHIRIDSVIKKRLVELNPLLLGKVSKRLNDT